MDFEERKKKFLDFVLTDFKVKSDELQCDLLPLPSFSPDGQGGWKVMCTIEIVDKAQVPIKSPFQTE